MYSSMVGSLLRTGSGLFVPIALPPFLVRLMGFQTFSAWSLALELAGYFTVLEAGCTSAAATLVARTETSKEAWAIGWMGRTRRSNS